MVMPAPVNGDVVAPTASIAGGLIFGGGSWTVVVGLLLSTKFDGFNQSLVSPD